jgi:hypothetical protein
MLLVTTQVWLIENLLFEVFLQEMALFAASQLPIVVLLGETTSLEMLLSVLLAAKPMASRAASVQLK